MNTKITIITVKYVIKQYGVTLDERSPPRIATTENYLQINSRGGRGMHWSSTPPSSFSFSGPARQWRLVRHFLCLLLLQQVWRLRSKINWIWKLVLSLFPKEKLFTKYILKFPGTENSVSLFLRISII